MWDFQKPARVALITDAGRIITYCELSEYTKRIARNIPERCLVFSLCTNSAGSVAGYAAFLNNRIVPLLLGSQMDASLMQALIDIYKPAYIWAPEKIKKRFEGSEVFSCLEYSLIKTHFTESYPLHPELGLLLTTSGSTGSPKLVRQSYRNIESNIKSIIKYLEMDENDRAITTLPMNYTYGLSVINTHLYCNASILLTEKQVIEKRFWDFFSENEATSFAGVPFTYEMLDKLGFFKLQLPSLRTMTQAGGKLLPECHRKFAEWAREKGVRFVVMYGATEATARMAYLPPEKAVEKEGSIGVAIPGGKLYLVDVKGNKINEPNTVGELVYEGDNVTLGYAECGKDLIKGDERGSRLETGDMAVCDADGYFYIVGRKKRFLKIFGNRVNLDEVERLLIKNLDTPECACSGIDDRMYVFVTGNVSKDKVVKVLCEKTGLNRAVFNVVKLDSIPRSDSGKTLYSELQRYYGT